MQVKRSGYFYLFGFITVFVLVSAVWFVMTYNTLVKKEEQVKVTWSQVESNMQRKLDLIPNLVRLVKSYMQHEKELLTKITELRSNAQSLLNKKIPTKKEIEQLSLLQKRLDKATMKLFATVENYPELRTSEQFLELQAQLEGSENRINITRMLFNEAVGEFNAYLRQIPANIVAKLVGFQPKAYFKANEQAHKSLKVEL